METRDRGVSEVNALGARPLQDVVGDADVVLVAFVAEWCGACTRLEPVLDSIAADTDAVAVTVDVETHLATAIEYGARGTPTVVIFVDGWPTKRIHGSLPEADLRARLSTYLE